MTYFFHCVSFHRLKGQIPDIRTSLDIVKHLQSKKVCIQSKYWMFIFLLFCVCLDFTRIETEITKSTLVSFSSASAFFAGIVDPPTPFPGLHYSKGHLKVWVTQWVNNKLMSFFPRADIACLLHRIECPNKRDCS